MIYQNVFIQLSNGKQGVFRGPAIATRAELEGGPEHEEDGVAVTQLLFSEADEGASGFEDLSDEEHKAMVEELSQLMTKLPANKEELEKILSEVEKTKDSESISEES
ncbi:hypothetical protein HOE37_06625 [Candidatus Woesearchaeota archaeon]|jgi:hypothetical protein|nr:hypothetical protein [Candidatus Woesearchaeota archaeon]